MSAANPKPQEPSMDEILASIRRIISDDQDAGRGERAAASPQRPGLQAPPEDEAELLEFEQDEALDMAPDDPFEPETAMAPAASSYDPPAPDRPVDLDEVRVTRQPAPVQATSAARRPDPVVAPAPTAPEPANIASTPSPVAFQASEPAETAHVEQLVSQETTASVGDAFQNLAHTVLSKNARTLEDLVRDMLRPMLKAWLDDNLPPLVERLVRAEIERVARGRP